MKLLQTTKVRFSVNKEVNVINPTIRSAPTIGVLGSFVSGQLAVENEFGKRLMRKIWFLSAGEVSLNG